MPVGLTPFVFEIDATNAGRVGAFGMSGKPILRHDDVVFEVLPCHRA